MPNGPYSIALFQQDLGLHIKHPLSWVETHPSVWMVPSNSYIHLQDTSDFPCRTYYPVLIEAHFPRIILDHMFRSLWNN